MPEIETVTSPNPRIRPRQVLLVGLGGVGSRTVDKVLSIMPEEYKKYTRAIVLDTDIGDLNDELHNVPAENRIALGSDPNTKQSITIGDYIRNHPRTTEWFVKGDKLDTIEKRSTTQGAKQIRMVSRIALAATNDFCGMKNVIEQVIRQFNADDGAVGGKGLLVMVVCSIAGGTGAGTVLQFPLYLEQAISGIFSDEDVQIDCSMLLPGMFRRVQSEDNFFAGKANAYAVIRELMSINSRKLRRGDIVANADLEVKKEKISPYGKVMFFDNTSMSGDTLDGNLEHTYIPKVATALNEYLFGPVNGKITSALDNTLRRVYNSDGQAIFGSVGTSRLYFPRSTYAQYVTANWITKAIENQWLGIDREAERMFKKEYKKAVDNNTERPDKEVRMRELYCQLVDEQKTPFFKEIKTKMNVTEEEKQGIKHEQVDNIAQLFWNICKNELDFRKEQNEEYRNARNQFKNDIESGGANIDFVIDSLRKSYNSAVKLSNVGNIYASQVLCPTEAIEETIYDGQTDIKTLFGFVKERKLHPIMIRYFIYKLAEILQKNSAHSGMAFIDENKFQKDYKKLNRDCKAALNKESGEIDSNISKEMYANFAETMLKDIKLYLEEYENMFKRLDEVIEYFNKNKSDCLKQLPEINNNSGVILAGGNLSMMYTWRKTKSEISAGEDVYTIDDDLNMKIHETVYRNFIKQYIDMANVKFETKDGKKLKVRTRYEEIMAKELQSYYAQKITVNYSHCLPQNVIEAALLQCGLENAYKTEAAQMDPTIGYNFKMFIERNPKPLNVDVSQNGMVSDADYFENLLSATIGKGKPFCGRVEGVGNDSPMISRLLIINRSMLRYEYDLTKIDENGEPEKQYLEGEIIKGVSSSRIDTNSVQTKFVNEGISRDEIISVTTVAGLEAKSFVAFLPPDDDEHSPTKEQSYYSAYREFIDGLGLNKSGITPHLHWRWHMAGMLKDVTASFTDTYSRQTVQAFLYGFIFDLITVGNDGVVCIGKLGESLFSEVMNGKSIEEFYLLEKHEHAAIDSLNADEKRNSMNTLLVKIFELLATEESLRNTIIAYAEREMAEFKAMNSPDFVGLCLDTESFGEAPEMELVKNEEGVESPREKEDKRVKYFCIIDIMIGYYHGTRHLSPAETARADKNIEEMFKFLLSTTYEVAKYVSHKDNSDAKEIYNAFVTMYYETAKSDDPIVSSASTVAPITTFTETDKKEQIDNWLNQITDSTIKKPKNPFEPGKSNMYSIDSALAMIDTLMDNE